MLTVGFINMPKVKRKSLRALSAEANETEDQTATVTPCRASENQWNDAKERMLAQMKLLG